jgi:hypothetical protein
MAPSIPATCPPIRILTEDPMGLLLKCIMKTIILTNIKPTSTTITKEINTVEM